MAGTFPEAEWIWHNGELIKWKDAKVHLLSLAVQFGSSVFEGIRCYDTDNGPAVFRLDDHLKRLYDSCRTYRMEVPYPVEHLVESCKQLIRTNELRECYLRPMVLRGYGAVGMDPRNSPIEVYLACWPWGAYLGEEALAQGVDVCVSSWLRPAPNTFPTSAKSAGHYNNAQLMKMEAIANGYAEAVALGPGGVVSEGSGQNVFLVENGEIVTPQIDGTSLRGITRDTIFKVAADLGIRVRQETVPRENLYNCDELFFSGTASEVTPIRSVDRIPIGTGKAGEVTMRIQRRFLDMVRNKVPDDRSWLTFIQDLL
jgi:branched-chain amino acid aminotransferase